MWLRGDRKGTCRQTIRAFLLRWNFIVKILLAPSIPLDIHLGHQFDSSSSSSLSVSGAMDRV